MDNSSNKKSNMARYSPALGLVCGSVVGDIVGLLSNQNIALFAAIGSGLGLVAGAIIFSIMVKNGTNEPNEPNIEDEPNEPNIADGPNEPNIANEPDEPNIADEANKPNVSDKTSSSM